MIQINLKKIVTKKEVLAVLDRLAEEMGTTIHIEDVTGKRLVGAESENLTNKYKYPIELSDKVIGWVLGEEKVAVVANLVSYFVKQEFEKKELANELLDKYREITLLHNISTQITASLDLKEVAQLVIEGVGKLLGSTGGSILLLNQKTNQLEPLSTFGQAFPPEEPLKLGEGIIGSIAQTGKGEIVNDVLSDPRFTHCQGLVSSLICVPLKTKEQTQGVIFLWSHSANDISSQVPVTYTSEDLKILTMFAYHAAVAIEKALLYEQSCITAMDAQAQAQQLQQALYELQHTKAHLIQIEKMSSLGELVAGIAHEINNPINFIHGNLTYFSDYAQDLLILINLYQQRHPTGDPEIKTLMQDLDLDFLTEDLPNTLTSMKVDVERIRKIVLSLRNLSRQHEAETKPVDIHESIDSALLILESRLKPMGKHSGIQIVKQYGNLPLVECHVNQLNQVFMNILANAIDAVENQKKPGIITLHTSVSEGDREQEVVIHIQDNGPGMSEEVRARLLDPFFTTKSVGKGTGLGLSISHQIIEKHGGTLKCQSQPEQGATFSIQIPVKPTVMLQPIFSPSIGRDFTSKLSFADVG
jgi:hypothetical protein